MNVGCISRLTDIQVRSPLHDRSQTKNRWGLAAVNISQNTFWHPPCNTAMRFGLWHGSFGSPLLLGIPTALRQSLGRGQQTFSRKRKKSFAPFTDLIPKVKPESCSRADVFKVPGNSRRMKRDGWISNISCTTIVGVLRLICFACVSSFVVSSFQVHPSFSLKSDKSFARRREYGWLDKIPISSLIRNDQDPSRHSNDQEINEV